MDAALGTKTRRNRGTISIACLCIVACMLGAEPTSRPSVSQSQIRTWFNQLADSDGTVRESAKQNLMSISRNDLPILRQVVAQSLPLAPSQTVELHDIFNQIFLADLPYESLDRAFLGMSWVPPATIIVPDEGVVTVQPVEPGIVISKRVLGFEAYRILRDGDLISSIQVDAQHELTVNPSNFASLVSTFPVGETLILHVTRDGRDFTARVLLRARPTALEAANADPDSWTNERVHVADKYWMANFAGLVGEELS